MSAQSSIFFTNNTRITLTAGSGIVFDQTGTVITISATGGGGGGSPGGVTNSIQTNNGAGGFGGDKNLIYDGSSITMNGGYGGISIQDIYGNSVGSDNGDGIYLLSQYGDYMYLDDGMYINSALGSALQMTDGLSFTDAYDNEIITNSSGGLAGNTSGGFYQWGNSASPFISLTDTVANTISMSPTGGIVLDDGTNGTGVGSNGQVWTSNGASGSWQPVGGSYLITPVSGTTFRVSPDSFGMTIISMNNTGNSIVTMCSPALAPLGIPLIIKAPNLAITNALKIEPFGNETIDTSNSLTPIAIISGGPGAVQPMVKILTPDNVNWIIIP